jgi:hypothetical protein
MEIDAAPAERVNPKELVFRLIHLIPACTFRAPRQPWCYPRFNGILINVTEH